ncbi:MAG: HAMP domain-containing protein [Planctomycetes bacterium]|nr:HAMP domain-containing protein [Planctomycetota bacterium]MCB9871914.1 HAMP domain-containing protein [Planctomycetota bacterium]MCB9888864.1 HAMP domain-containing protein [Planctomycetota bacterium]
MIRPALPLAAKFLLLHVLVLVAVIAAIWLSIDWLAADYFMTLMKRFHLDAPEVNAMFLHSSERALLQVGGVGLLVATVLCFWLTRRILAPLRQIGRATERVAVGDYGCRVDVTTRDELAALARRFNDMAESLQRMEQARKRMVVDVAHELRTPLTNMRGHIEALQDGLLRPSARVLKVLHDELLRLVRLTEDLLAAARDARRGTDDHRPVLLRPLLEQAVEMFRLRFNRRGIELRLDLREAEVEILANPDQLEQVFGNLLQNCLQYTPDRGWVKVAAVTRDAVLRIVFSNAGDGIEAGDLPWIFEPYYRVDRSRSRDSGGAGIGLAIVQTLVEKHGGSVGASSGPDANRVWVELPRAG